MNAIFWKHLRDDVASKLEGILTEEQTKNVIQTLDYIDSQIASEGNGQITETERIRRRIANEASINEHSLAEMVGALSYRIWSLEIACASAAKALVKSLESEESEFMFRHDVSVIAGMLAEYGAGEAPKFTE